MAVVAAGTVTHHAVCNDSAGSVDALMRSHAGCPAGRRAKEDKDKRYESDRKATQAHRQAEAAAKEAAAAAAAKEAAAAGDVAAASLTGHESSDAAHATLSEGLKSIKSAVAAARRESGAVSGVQRKGVVNPKLGSASATGGVAASGGAGTSSSGSAVSGVVRSRAEMEAASSSSGSSSGDDAAGPAAKRARLDDSASASAAPVPAAPAQPTTERNQSAADALRAMLRMPPRSVAAVGAASFVPAPAATSAADADAAPAAPTAIAEEGSATSSAVVETETIAIPAALAAQAAAALAAAADPAASPTSSSAADSDDDTDPDTGEKMTSTHTGSRIIDDSDALLEGDVATAVSVMLKGAVKQALDARRTHDGVVDEVRTHAAGETPRCCHALVRCLTSNIPFCVLRVAGGAGRSWWLSRPLLRLQVRA